MCGIFGILGPQADKDWIAETMQKLFESAEIRGDDASGLAWVDKDENGEFFVNILKKPVKGTVFAYDEDLMNLLFGDNCPTNIIGHCRGTSQGDESNNENNHPILGTETGMALVHNGRVQDFMWRATDDNGDNPFILGEFKAAVDTEAIMRLLETLLFIPRNEDGTIDPDVVAATPKDQWSKKANVPVLKAIDDTVFNLAGKNTCALLDPDTPDCVYMWHVENPLFISFVPSQKAVVFASTEDILKKSLAQIETETLFNFFEISRKEVITQYHGINTKDKSVFQVTWTGKEGDEFEFNWFELDPDSADFTSQTSKDREVTASTASNVATVN